MATKVTGTLGVGLGSKVVGVPTPSVNHIQVDKTSAGSTLTVSRNLPSTASVAVATLGASYPSDGSGNATISIIYKGQTVATKTISSPSDYPYFKCSAVIVLDGSYSISWKVDLSSYSGSDIFSVMSIIVI